MKLIKMDMTQIIAIIFLLSFTAANNFKLQAKMENQAIFPTLCKQAWGYAGPKAVIGAGLFLTQVSVYGTGSDLNKAIKSGDLKGIGTIGIGVASALLPHKKYLGTADFALKVYNYLKTPLGMGPSGDLADVVGAKYGYKNVKILGKAFTTTNICHEKQDEVRLNIQAAHKYLTTDISKRYGGEFNPLDEHIFLSSPFRRRVMTETGSKKKTSPLKTFNEEEVADILKDLKKTVLTIRPNLEDKIDRLISFVCPCIYWAHASIAESEVIVPTNDSCALVKPETKQAMLAIVTKLKCFKPDGDTTLTEREYIDGQNFFSAASKSFGLIPI